MKVSIITVVFNNQKTIKDAINSVLGQSYKNIEYIVIDGASSDGTIEIVKSYGNKISHFVSEPDNGIYDALNKGIALTTGDIIAFLHSDDMYANENVISDVVNLFNVDTQGVYGDLIYIDRVDTNKVFRYWRSGNFSLKKLSKGWMPPHPTLFLHREVYQKYGVFDVSFKIAGDYDFMLRILKENILVKYFPEVLYKMRTGGASNRSIKNIFNKSREDLRAMKKNGVKRSFLILFYKNISKILQLINR
ncbi:Colanic acid biosynthesis glycosyl transferase WcaE [uncultured Candidatus Thioglobus sp.]|nr:Colanic acid biosynthesis glycosyl transferase WcaE [uncultured Candidatus Thioglobus sp.]